MTNPADLAKRYEYSNRPKTCTMPDCDNKYRTFGLCQKHYTQAYRYFQKHGRPDDRLNLPVITPLPAGERTKFCTYNDCTSKVRARGLCSSHYFQHYRQAAK